MFSIASICGSLATLKLELSIPVAKSFSDANSRTTLTLFVSLMLNVFMIILFLLLGFVPNYSSLLFVFLISCIVSINATFNQLFLQSESFIVTGFIPLFLAVANLLFLQILNGFGGNPILFAFILSSVLVMAINIGVSKYFGFKFIVKTEILASTFLELKNYPFFIFPGSVLIIFSTYIVPIILDLLYTKEDVGVYAYSLRILMLPSIVFGSVAGSIFRVRMAKLYHLSDIVEINRLTKKLFILLILVVLISFPSILFLVDYVFNILGLKMWKDLNLILIFLVPFAIGQLFFQTFSNILLVFNKNGMFFFLNGLQLATIVISFILALIFQFRFDLFILIISISSLFVSIYSSFKMLNLVRCQKV